MPSTKTSAQEQISQQRAEIVEDIIKNMQKDGLQWADNLIYHLCPLNPTTGTLYKGVNKFRLAWAAHHFVFTDNRWCTFKQIKDNGWHIVKGSKGGIIPACAGNIKCSIFIIDLLEGSSPRVRGTSMACKTI